ncbi:MAG: hypothetical protein OSJ61_07630 [Lachnospiraceae bacterium]|nr:hypothetical protein [Lachnospiraceae bacterium]
MTLEFICKGYLATTKEETTYTIEIAAENDFPECFKEILQKGELNSDHYSYTINIALRELSWFKNIIFKNVIAINEKHKYIYLVMLEWLTEDDNGFDYYLYRNYNDAKDKYKRLIVDENDADISWVGSEVFDENGEVNEDFEFECSEETDEEKNLCWKVADAKSYNRYSIITLTKVEIL